MNIDDLLLDPQFKEMDSFLSKEMYRLSDTELLEEMRNVFEDEVYFRNWFYSNIHSLGNKRPYDLCKEGKSEEVKDVLGRIKYGVY